MKSAVLAAGLSLAVAPASYAAELGHGCKLNNQVYDTARFFATSQVNLGAELRQAGIGSLDKLMENSFYAGKLCQFHQMRSQSDGKYDFSILKSYDPRNCSQFIAVWDVIGVKRVKTMVVLPDGQVVQKQPSGESIDNTKKNDFELVEKLLKGYSCQN